MRTLLLVLASGMPLAAQPDPIRGDLIDLLLETQGPEQAIKLLLARARQAGKGPRATAMLECARDCAIAHGAGRKATEIDHWLSWSGGRDLLELRLDTLRRLAARGGHGGLALAALRLGDEELDRDANCRLEPVLDAARELAPRFDLLLEREIARAAAELTTARAIRQRAAAALARCDDERWKRDRKLFSAFRADPGKEILDPKLQRMKADPAPDGRACLSIAESIRARAKTLEGSASERSLVQRKLDGYALTWYASAWLGSEGPEQLRIHRLMAGIEDRLGREREIGNVRFELLHPDPYLPPLVEPSLELHLVFDQSDGCVRRIEDGVLYLASTGKRARYTHRFAYERIRSVTIRGGIASKGRLNFRFVAGTLNAICNWEVEPHNEYHLDGKRTAKAPPLFRDNAEHTLRIRQMGDQVVFFFDDEVAFAGEGKLAGTVAVYPAVGSEIFVREILIDGDVDPYTVVDGPIGTNL